MVTWTAGDDLIAWISATPTTSGPPGTTRISTGTGTWTGPRSAPCRRACSIGCGTGKDTAIFSGCRARVQPQPLPRHAPQPAVRAPDSASSSRPRPTLVRSWPVRAGSVDLVACSSVLEHLERLEGIFTEAARVLAPGGHFLVSELHPYRQYRGTTARYERDGLEVTIPAHVHHVSDFLRAARGHGMRLRRPGDVQEWWASPGRGKAAAADHGPVRGLRGGLKRRRMTTASPGSGSPTGTPGMARRTPPPDQAGCPVPAGFIFGPRGGEANRMVPPPDAPDRARRWRAEVPALSRGNFPGETGCFFESGWRLQAPRGDMAVYPGCSYSLDSSTPKMLWSGVWKTIRGPLARSRPASHRSRLVEAILPKSAGPMGLSVLPAAGRPDGRPNADSGCAASADDRPQ